MFGRQRTEKYFEEKPSKANPNRGGSQSDENRLGTFEQSDNKHKKR
jgi:hypothetical protein